jgi:hypothetical protein
MRSARERVSRGPVRRPGPSFPPPQGFLRIPPDPSPGSPMPGTTSQGAEGLHTFPKLFICYMARRTGPHIPASRAARLLRRPRPARRPLPGPAEPRGRWSARPGTPPGSPRPQQRRAQAGRGAGTRTDRLRRGRDLRGGARRLAARADRGHLRRDRPPGLASPRHPPPHASAVKRSRRGFPGPGTDSTQDFREPRQPGVVPHVWWGEGGFPGRVFGPRRRLTHQCSINLPGVVSLCGISAPRS